MVTKGKKKHRSSTASRAYDGGGIQPEPGQNAHWTPRLEPMQLNRGTRNTILSEEREYLRALITLKLEHLSHLFVIH